MFSMMKVRYSSISIKILGTPRMPPLIKRSVPSSWPTRCPVKYLRLQQTHFLDQLRRFPPFLISRLLFFVHWPDASTPEVTYPRLFPSDSFPHPNSLLFLFETPLIKTFWRKTRTGPLPISCNRIWRFVSCPHPRPPPCFLSFFSRIFPPLHHSRARPKG